MRKIWLFLLLFYLCFAMSAFAYPDSNAVDVNITGGGTDDLAYTRNYTESFTIGLTTTYGHINRVKFDFNASKSAQHVPSNSIITGIALIINIISETITNDTGQFVGRTDNIFSYEDSNAGNWALSEDGNGTSYGSGYNINTIGSLTLPLNSDALADFINAYINDLNWLVSWETSEATAEESIDFNVTALDLNYNLKPVVEIIEVRDLVDTDPILVSFVNCGDANCNLDFEAFDSEGDDLNVDIGFGTTWDDDANNMHYQDVNLDSTYCLTDLNADSKSVCTFTFDPRQLVPDMNYFAIVHYGDGYNTKDFNSSDFSTGFLVDTTVPSTDQNAVHETVYSSDLNINFSCSDNLAGCKNFTYGVGDVNKVLAWGDSNIGVPFNSDGVYEIFYYSTDGADNNETTTYLKVQIDKPKSRGGGGATGYIIGCDFNVSPDYIEYYYSGESVLLPVINISSAIDVRLNPIFTCIEGFDCLKDYCFITNSMFLVEGEQRQVQIECSLPEGEDRVLAGTLHLTSFANAACSKPVDIYLSKQNELFAPAFSFEILFWLLLVVLIVLGIIAAYTRNWVWGLLFLAVLIVFLFLFFGKLLVLIYTVNFL